MSSGPVYLDCAATTPIDPRVLEETVRFMAGEFGNAGSRTHDFGHRARQAVEQARDRVAAAAGCSRGEVFFTSGATESNNLAILGLAEHGRKTGRRHLVSTGIEHSAVLEPLGFLMRNGFELTLVAPSPGGRVEPERIAAALRDETLLVSVMHVNNETGIVQPVARIARALADHPAFFHVDAAQGFGLLGDELRDGRIDLVSISGHKIHAPKGVGALVARRRDGLRPPLTPIMYGGGQEMGLRPGTVPVPLVAALGLAAQLAVDERTQRREQCLAFGRRLAEELAPLSPQYNGDRNHCAPHIVNLSFPGVDAESAMAALRDVAAVSHGATCASGSGLCSHVLRAMGLGEDRIDGALRISWCHMTPQPDWHRFRSAIQNLTSR